MLGLLCNCICYLDFLSQAVKDVYILSKVRVVSWKNVIWTWLTKSCLPAFFARADTVCSCNIYFHGSKFSAFQTRKSLNNWDDSVKRKLYGLFNTLISRLNHFAKKLHMLGVIFLLLQLVLPVRTEASSPCRELKVLAFGIATLRTFGKIWTCAQTLSDVRTESSVLNAKGPN